ncbi:helix-turn-helix transcriptional regulator [Bacillus safensis]|uniref:helix-turn-helix transcriptional regulator n=1 Tax=Bacillus safensis TaxID=561879 RepID=UPI002EACA0C6|nr:helix-turn-helix transcriptional regulator [Bacillus safensis]
MRYFNPLRIFLKEVKTIKNIVKEKRKEKGWTQFHLATVSGVSQATISKIENGDYNKSSLAVMMKIAQTLGIKIEDLTENL